MIRLEGVVAGYGGGNVLQGVDLALEPAPAYGSPREKFAQGSVPASAPELVTSGP